MSRKVKLVRNQVDFEPISNGFGSVCETCLEKFGKLGISLFVVIVSAE